MSKRKMELPECLKGIAVRRELVNVFKIESHCIGSQREIDSDRAINICKNWSDFFVTDPILSYDTKTGAYHEPSGQHTCAGYLWRIQNGLESNTSIMCRVADDLTEEQLNAIFAYEAIMREPQKSNAVMKSLWEANDPYLHKLSTFVNAYGYTIPCNQNGNPSIRCFSTMADMTTEDLNSCLEFISYLFPYDKKKGKKKWNTKSVEAVFLKAVKLFKEWYPTDVDIKKFKDFVDSNDIFANDIAKEASLLSEFDKKPVIRITYILVRKYNSCVRKSNRLSFLNFEDYR